jgi:serine/threonine protein kinase
MEVGETDLNNLLIEHSGKAISMNFIRYIWEQVCRARFSRRSLRLETSSLTPPSLPLRTQQMLEAVQVIHDENVVHTDLKPANFVLVKGRLKLIDFGISKAIANDTTNIGRDQQIGTANYMPPEALIDSGLGRDGKRLMKVSLAPLLSPLTRRSGPLGTEALTSPLLSLPTPPSSLPPTVTSTASPSSPSFHRQLGRAADVWSLGCILHQMVYGRTPFSHLRDVSHKIMAIQNPRHVIQFADFSCPVDERGVEKKELEVRVGQEVKETMRSCLRFHQRERMTIPELLGAPFLRGEGRRVESAKEEGKKSGELAVTDPIDGRGLTFSPPHYRPTHHRRRDDARPSQARIENVHRRGARREPRPPTHRRELSFLLPVSSTSSLISSRRQKLMNELRATQASV